jgi:polyisoprenoid-binding protein YceI
MKTEGTIMKLKKLAVGILVFAAPFAMAQTSTWKSDPAHSEVDFKIKHLSISNVHGRFGHVNATIMYDEKDVTKSTVNAIIDLTGVETGESGRDDHLKTPDFFDAAKYATASFSSASVAKGGSGLLVSGNLTIKGITKPVVLDVEGPTASVLGMDQKPHVGFSASTTIDRLDFGLGSAMPPAMIGDEVRITIDLDVVKQ